MKTVRNIHLDDEYIERMANYYTSDMVKKLFPHIREISFYEWLKREADKRNQKIG